MLISSLFSAFEGARRYINAQGIEGQYIEFDPSYSPEEENERLHGPSYVINPSLGACA